MKRDLLLLYKCVFLVVCLLPINLVLAQSETAHPPAGAARSVSSLSQHLSVGGQENNVRAIYHWMTHNMTLDAKSVEKGKAKPQTPGQVLSKRQGTAPQLATLFNALCEAANLRAYSVSGYAKKLFYAPGDLFVAENHTWNAVEIGGEWFLVDVAWGSGYLAHKERMLPRLLHRPYVKKHLYFVTKPTDKWLLTAPDIFLLTHFPSDPTWQLQKCPVPVAICEQPDSVIQSYLQTQQSVSVCYNYRDTLAAFIKTTAHERQMQSSMRAVQHNPRNPGIAGAGHLQLAKHHLQPLIDNPETQADSNLEHAIAAARHFELALPYLSHQKDSTKNQYRSRLGELSARNKKLSRRFEKLNILNGRTVDQNRITAKSFRLRKKGLKQRNRYLRKQNDRLMEENLDKVKRAKKPADKITEQKITNNRFLISENFKTIAANKSESIYLYEDSIRRSLSTIKAHRQIIRRNLKNNALLLASHQILQTEAQRKLFALTNELADSVSAHVAVNDSLRRESLVLEKTTIKNNKKRIGENYRFNIRLIRKNKRLIRKNKKLSQKDREEDAQFRKESELIIAENSLNIDRNEQKLEDLLEEKTTLKRENKQLKKEKKSFKRINRLEQHSFRYFQHQTNRYYKIDAKKDLVNISESKSYLRLAKKEIKRLKKILEEESEPEKNP